MRRDLSKLETARLTATLSIAVRSATCAAESPGSRPNTAITRHSGIDSPNRAAYAPAIAVLTILVNTDNR